MLLALGTVVGVVTLEAFLGCELSQAVVERALHMAPETRKRMQEGGGSNSTAEEGRWSREETEGAGGYDRRSKHATCSPSSALGDAAAISAVSTSTSTLSLRCRRHSERNMLPRDLAQGMQSICRVGTEELSIQCSRPAR